MKQNIILIGMPGAGKSTIGVLLAKIMGCNFIDSDLVIQSQQGKLLREIIAEKGQDGFLKVEEEVNCNLNPLKAVIATGGSAIYGKKAMEHFKKIGIIVYIKLSCESLQERLGNIVRRGVVLKEGQTFEDLYKERCPLYEQYADIIIETENNTIEGSLDLIAEKILNN